MSYSDYFEQERTQFGAPRVTWAVQRLILANIAVFTVQLLIGPFQYLVFSNYSFSEDFPGGMLNIWLGFQPNLFFKGLIWKPFTYMFLHSGIMHLGFNMLWLFFFGPDVERRLGTMHFFRFYVLCGAAGVLLTCLPYVMGVTPDPDRITVIGASGSVMGVLVAFAMIAPNRQFYIMPFPWPITARGLVVLIVIMNLVMGVDDSSTSVATHFGGMITAFLYMRFYPRISRDMIGRLRPTAKRRGTEAPSKVGEAVDNIFKFKDTDRR